MFKNDYNYLVFLILFEICICYLKNMYCMDVGFFYFLCYYVCLGLEYDCVYEFVFKVFVNCCDDVDIFLL